jgi:hypothetical protein
MKRTTIILIYLVFSSFLIAQTSSMTLEGTGTPATSAHMTITESGGKYAP